MDENEQQRWLDAVAAAADAEGCLVAPVGSAFFLFATPRAHTKDVDVVVHDAGLEPAALPVLKRIAGRLGEAEVTTDDAVVRITPVGARAGESIELIRGRRRARGGFFPRALLREAAERAERRGALLLYPIEYVLVLKADAAIDREERAERDEAHADENRRRAAAFRADAFREVNRAMQEDGLDGALLASAVGHLKKKRQKGVSAMLSAAGAPHGPAGGLS